MATTGALTCSTNRQASYTAVIRKSMLLRLVTHTSREETVIHSPVLAFIVAGVLWLLAFMAEMPMPYSVPGSRSEHREKQNL